MEKRWKKVWKMRWFFRLPFVHWSVFFFFVRIDSHLDVTNRTLYFSKIKGIPQNGSISQTFWQLCINKHCPPPHPLPPFCHGTAVRDCLPVEHQCLGLGPKPDNLTVIHSKVIKHLQRCHEQERAPFISVLHHQHAGRASLPSRRLNLPM